MSVKKISDALRTPESEIIEFCESKGCFFLSSFIHKKRVRIKYICKCGVPAESAWGNFKKIKNCWDCGQLKKSGEKCYMWNPDREEVKSNKYWRKVCGRIVYRCLQNVGTPKAELTSHLLGFTPAQLKVHVESHPNYPGKDVEYHIDHIFPIKAFLDYGITDLKIMNALDNLRPLPVFENISKGDSYDSLAFEAWLIGKNILISN